MLPDQELLQERSAASFSLCHPDHPFVITEGIPCGNEGGACADGRHSGSSRQNKGYAHRGGGRYGKSDDAVGQRLGLNVVYGKDVVRKVGENDD